jgi:hypothetical protein
MGHDGFCFGSFPLFFYLQINVVKFFNVEDLIFHIFVFYIFSLVCNHWKVVITT